jgi:hypothetical protein
VKKLVKKNENSSRARANVEKNAHIDDISPHNAAKIVGVAYIIMFLAVISTTPTMSVIVPGDAAETVNKLIASEMLFRVGIFGYLIVIICDLVMAWALYVLLKPVNKSLSLLNAWGRLVYTTILGATLFNLVNALRLVNGAEYLGFETNQLYAKVLLSLNAFSDGWAIGYVFFSLHLFFLGYLVYKSDYIPKNLGILLILSSLTYLIDNVAKLILPTYANFKTIFTAMAVPSFLGEFLLVLWLLSKGLKVIQFGERV